MRHTAKTGLRGRSTPVCPREQESPPPQSRWTLNRAWDSNEAFASRDLRGGRQGREATQGRAGAWLVSVLGRSCEDVGTGRRGPPRATEGPHVLLRGGRRCPMGEAHPLVASSGLEPGWMCGFKRSWAAARRADGGPGKRRSRPTGTGARISLVVSDKLCTEAGTRDVCTCSARSSPGPQQVSPAPGVGNGL